MFVWLWSFLKIILMRKVAANTKLTSMQEYAIRYFFHTFMISLMTSFYKEANELSVINTKKSLCSGVPQSAIKTGLDNIAKNKTSL